MQGGTTEAQNRNEEVYSGAVDGLSSSDVNAVLEEIEHEADVLKHAFQKAMHRAMGHVALLGKLQLCFVSGSTAMHSCHLFCRPQA